jgi:hypothetical protein
MDCLDQLKSAFPTCAFYITEFARLQKEAASVPLGEFFEPKVPISLKEDDPPDLLMLIAERVTSWAAHVSSGARVRMRSLENAFTSELLNARLFPAMAMIRAHLETAAFSAYGLEAAGRCADSEQWDAMKRIIPQMLFGTAYKLEKKAPAMQRMLDLSDQEPVRIMKMIEALDQFVEQTERPQSHWYRLMYAILCEYTHPTMRSMNPFYTVHKETLAGWDLKYGYQESFNEQSVAMAFDMMLRSMKAGYGASLLLASWKFEDSPSGGIACDKTPRDFGQWIWERILHWPGDLPEAPNFAYEAKRC